MWESIFLYFVDRSHGKQQTSVAADYSRGKWRWKGDRFCCTSCFVKSVNSQFSIPMKWDSSPLLMNNPWMIFFSAGDWLCERTGWWRSVGWPYQLFSWQTRYSFYSVLLLDCRSLSFAAVFRDVTQRGALRDIPKDAYHLLELAGPKELR